MSAPFRRTRPGPSAGRRGARRPASAAGADRTHVPRPDGPGTATPAVPSGRAFVHALAGRTRLAQSTRRLAPGSLWWRAVNERLLRDGCESVALAGALNGEPSSKTVRLWMKFIAKPTGRNWYRAHNASIVGGYLEHKELAEAESSRSSLARPRATRPLSARAGCRDLPRSRAAPRPAARLRGDPATAAADVPVVRRRAERARPTRTGSRREPNLCVALRGATGVALTGHAVGGAGPRTRDQAPVRPGATIVVERPMREASNQPPPSCSGRLVVGAATIAPVGAYVSSLGVSAERCTVSRQRPL
jgi:hypothetical protein